MLLDTMGELMHRIGTQMAEIWIGIQMTEIWIFMFLFAEFGMPIHIWSPPNYNKVWPF